MASAPTSRLRNGAVTTFVNATASGNTEAIAAAGAGLMIRVVSIFVLSETALTVKFQSATTDVTAGFPVGINGGFVLEHNDEGWFQSAANEALNINLSGTGVVGAQINYKITQV